MAARLPPVDPSLIEFLEKKFPNRVPDLETPDREVWARAGEQRVVGFLKRIVKRVTEENLNVGS